MIKHIGRVLVQRRERIIIGLAVNEYDDHIVLDHCIYADTMQRVGSEVTILDDDRYVFYAGRTDVAKWMDIVCTVPAPYSLQ